MVPIHPQLRTETHQLGLFESSTVLLHRNASVPWLILVPDTEITSFLDLDADFQSRLLEESKRAASFVKAHFKLTKINFAAIGNIVSQMHLHVVGRDPGDSCWPQPVWGHLTVNADYSDADLEAIVQRLCAEYSLQNPA